jgi:hypothetical protein
MKKSPKKKKINKKTLYKKGHFKNPFSLGNIHPEKGRLLILSLVVIFFCTILIVQQYALNEAYNRPSKTTYVYITKENPIDAEIRSMVKGYPIEQMTPYITQQDPKVAAFMIAIAKKESAWGEHHPVLNGRDCYNYWGFRLKTDKMGSGGHTCFDSPEQAVDTVAQRINELVNVENVNSAKEMIVWKCGYSCQNQPKTYDEQKWISDVNMYYQPLMN